MELDKYIVSSLRGVLKNPLVYSMLVYFLLKIPSIKKLSGHFVLK